MKIGRQAKIIDLIGRYDIETQEELAGYLKEEGFRVTQATISRDIRELKLTKISVNGGHQKYAVLSPGSQQMSEKYLRVLRDGFINMDRAGNILVINTVSGMAMAVALALDNLRLPEVVGTIAGDDTIMAAVKTGDEAEILKEKMRRLLEEA